MLNATNNNGLQKMAQIISVLNNKGGVGKTMLTASAADGLGRLGKKCLVIDLDPQGNSSFWLAPKHPESLLLTVGNLLLAQPIDLEELLAKTILTEVSAKKTHLIPANSSLDDSVRKLQNTVVSQQTRLKRIIESVRDRYDYIIVAAHLKVTI